MVGYLRTNWSQDPFSAGSYSYYAKAEQAGDRTELAKPIGDRLFFAGEACHPQYNSTVHAAHESGLIAAKAILETSAKTIGIVGAGMSGLTAAHLLSKSGRSVTLIEARDRIGGRIWTSDELGVPLDLGASWIHGTDGNLLTKMADMQGVQRLPTDEESYSVRGNGGEKLLPEQQPDWLFHEAEAQVSLGADIALIDPKALTHGDGYSGNDVILPGGYDQLLDGLKGDYSLLLSRKVNSISLNSDTLQIGIEGADNLSFDAALVTVPLGVLKAQTIEFAPPLPDAKLAAISRIGMGTLDKIYLRFEDAFWDDETWLYTSDTGHPLGHFNQWLNLRPHLDQPIIVALNGGSAAQSLAQLSDREVVRRAIDVLDRAYPE